MLMLEVAVALIFIVGYTGIALEDRLFVNKAATSLMLGAALWVIAAVVLPTYRLQEYLVETSADIFGLIIFLLTAMTLVEILIHYHFFDFIEYWLRKRGWTQHQLGWAVAVIAFVFSAFIDNLTTTIVAIQITRRMFTAKARLYIAVLVVIAANAGGAFSPIGDVTTLMLWFAKKFTAEQVIIQGFLPSLVLALVAAVLLLRKVDNAPAVQNKYSKNANNFNPSNTDWAVIIATLGSFLLPLLTAGIGLPPYMGLVAGLGLVWFLIDVARRARPQETHLKARIQKFFQQTDLESIQFFLGILLAVGALHALGVLDIATRWLLNDFPSEAQIVLAFVSFGVGSAVVDNVPLTAAVISSLPQIPAHLWVLLAIAVGTGGSLLAVGSAAGVIAMGMMQGLTFTKYLKIGTLPALLGFIAAMGAWIVQYWLFF
jgi:Na+/H+ antiporter NhaD/arsenite permease-like protein